MVREKNVRVKRYIAKYDSKTIAKRFDTQLNRLAELLRIWLIVQDNTEIETLKLLRTENINPELYPYYIAYTKKQINRAFRFEVYTMLNELIINIDTYFKRGLEKTILEILREPQEKWASVWFYMLGYLKNAYADFCFADYCKCF